MTCSFVAQVLSSELKVTRTVSSDLEEDYKPTSIYLVLQKRHHARFFPPDENQYRWQPHDLELSNVQNVNVVLQNRDGNILAGTVLGINQSTEGDIFLVSHEGIQGTSRPTHYQVISDANWVYFSRPRST